MKILHHSCGLKPFKRFMGLALLTLAFAATSCESTDGRSEANPALSLPFIEDNYEKALALAKERKLPLFVDTWAPWCHSCVFLREHVLTRPELARNADRFVFLALNTEEPTATAFLASYPVEIWPTLFIIDSKSGRLSLKWQGTATVEQLEGLFDDGEKAVAEVPGEDSASLLARADVLNAQGKPQLAALALEEAVRKASANWDRRPRAVESWLRALSDAKQYEACAHTAIHELPTLPKGQSFLNVSWTGMDCAASADEGQSWKKSALQTLELRVHEALGFDNVLADDKSGLYESLVAVRLAEGDATGAKALGIQWLRFLEAEAAKAPSPPARAVFDSHLVRAAIAAGTPARAEAALKRSAADFPDDGNVLARLALIYSEEGRLAEALSYIDGGLEKIDGPQKVRLLEIKAEVLAKTGDKASQRAVLDKAIVHGHALPASQQPVFVLTRIKANVNALQEASTAAENHRTAAPSPLDAATGGSGDSHSARADQFLAAYSTKFQHLETLADEAEWLTQTHIVDGDSTNAVRSNAAKVALAEFTGSEKVIAETRDLLANAKQLKPLQARQLKMILYTAADKPATAKELVAERIAATTRQTEALYGYTFRLDGKEVSANDLDRVLREETDLGKRQRAWEASKELGRGLKDGLADLQRLRNGTVQAMGYSDYFSYMVSEYDMTTQEMMALNDEAVRQLRPLYRELHTWVRYELAKRYGVSVPDLIPAHWLPNRWSQDWSDLIKIDGMNLDPVLKEKPPEWLVKQAERFYVSLGFQPLPAIFWEKSSLYPVPTGAKWKKNNHATAWHIDLDQSVRSLMSVESNSYWYETTHHELGHIYYYLAYSNPTIPIVLRDGANRAYHEAVGTLMGLAAMQPKFLATVGLTADGKPLQLSEEQKRLLLLRDALSYVVLVPWSSGVMTHFEHELYAKGLQKEQWNKRWWEMVARFQGVAPPTDRGEQYCDAATKTHINDDPAAYYDYALANLLLFQLHDHVARKILHEDPHDTNYYGRREIGDFLKEIFAPGASVDWRQLMRDTTGEELSAAPMLRYFEPLMEWLKKENEGRKHTLADL